MRRSTLVWPCVVLAVVTAVAPVAAAARSGDRNFEPWGVDLGLEVAQFKYEEPGAMTEQGPQAGLYTGYTHFFFGRLRAQVYASVVGGDLDYDGGVYVRDPDTSELYTLGATCTTPNVIFNGRVTGGYRFALGPLELTPYSGYGYRYLRNDLNQSINVESYGWVDSPESGYWRKQTYHYLPLGFVLGAPMGGDWRVEGTLEYDLFLRGRNHSYNDYGLDSTFTQTGGSGYRFALKTLSPVVASFARFTIEAFYERWEVDESDRVWESPTRYTLEPRNNSTLYGVRIGVSL